ncbi:MAG: S1 family peptidase [Deltaproteobacteria bacterium]|nr:S1 family peptidase [Deltaproteobacteria bacterium]
MRRRLTLLPLIATLAAGTTTGCAPEPEAQRLAEAIATAPQPIMGGYLDDFDHHVVGMVHVSNMGFASCSGTLIAPNVILTAQHCVAPVSGDGSVQCGVTVFGSQYAASELWVTTHPEFTYDPSNYHTGMEIVIPPAGTAFCGNDQAIVILETPVPETEAVPATPRVDESLVMGEEYSAIGYGETLDGQQDSGTRYRRDSLFTACVAEDCPTGYVAQTEWLGETGVCQGDSGGPAVDLLGRVVGVASRGGAGCSNPVYGHVFGWGDWIKNTVIYASGLAGLDPPPWTDGWPTDPAYGHPVGAECALPEDCPSNLCLDGYCTRACNEDAPCPEGFECLPENGVCTRIPEPEPEASSSGKETTVSSCAVERIGKDPTKPLPWKVVPVLGGLLLLGLRRRRARR